MTLMDSQIRIGQTVEIQGFSGSESISERLHEMGLYEGVRLFILGRAPFGGPLLVRFSHSFLALRHEEAQCAQVTLK